MTKVEVDFIVVVEHALKFGYSTYIAIAKFNVGSFYKHTTFPTFQLNSTNPLVDIDDYLLTFIPMSVGWGVEGIDLFPDKISWVLVLVLVLVPACTKVVAVNQASGRVVTATKCPVFLMPISLPLSVAVPRFIIMRIVKAPVFSKPSFSPSFVRAIALMPLLDVTSIMVSVSNMI